MSWTTFTLRTTTPLFLDKEAIPRVASIRGALRFWFRALVATRVGNDIATLRTMESMTFGSLEHPSPVRMRIPHPPKGTPNGGIASVFKVPKSEAWWIGYLLGQGHSKIEHSTPKLSRHFLPVNTDFQLKMRLSDTPEVNALLVASLWLMCTYGGLGARTRRGFGGLRIEQVEGNLPDPWTKDDVVTPGLDYYASLDSLLPAPGRPERSALDASLEQLPRFGLTLRGLSQRPDYPAVSDTFTVAGLSEYTGATWSETAGWIGERYRHFRASEKHPTADYQPAVKTPEYRAFTEPGERLPGPRKNEFPLGAFGLPVQFKKKIQVNATASGNSLRRASPMWIRIVNDIESGRWRVFSFAFLNDYFSGDQKPNVTVKNAEQGPRDLLVPNELVESQAAAWFRVVQGIEDPT